MRNHHTHTERKHGSALILVVIVSAVIGLIVASVVRGTSTEIKINDRYITRLKAKSAAESAIEYGASELVYRFNNKTGFPTNALSSGNDPLSIPESASTFLVSKDVDPSKLKIHGGVIPPGEWVYYNPDDPANEFDPMRGRRALVREIELYGKGEASTAGGDSIAAYATELFQVRDAPLFANAIFYNGDLEINPGSNMDIYGPVHTNGDLYVGAKSSATLKFHDKVTSSQSFLHDEIRPIHIGNGKNVQFPSSTDPEILRGMKANGQIIDSTDPDWVNEASERWNGYVQNGDMGVGKQNVVAFDDYERDDFNTPALERMNSGYAIIEPLLPHGHPDRKSAEIREQKMALKAGLLLRVESDPSRGSPSDSDYWQVKAYKYQRSNSSDPLSAPTFDKNGDPILVEVKLPRDVIGNPSNGMNSVEDDNMERYAYTPGPWWRPTTGGLYDHRENKGISLLGLDVGRLKSHIDAKNNFLNTYDVDNDWNGVVYVEFPTSTSRNGDGSFEYGTSSGKNNYNIVPGAFDDIALMVMNAREIPEPANPSQEGFTLTTNAPMYTVGSFNANGAAHKDDAYVTDDASESPAALMADTITVLSDNWPSNRGYSYLDGRSYLSNYRRASNYVEISAALVSGTPNTIPSGASHPGASSSRPLSLGVVNLPRFLEYWTGRTLTIRGSLVSLYESEVRPLGAPTNFNDFYTPPARDWGFNELFKSGNYPPGTPRLRTYRRLMFEQIDKTTYDKAVANMN